MRPFAFALAGQGTDTLELDVYADIGEGFWFDSVSASSIRRQLKENAKAKTIKLRINSDGGDVFDAQSIYTDLQAHAGRKEATITGVAASAATLIAMACDEIAMAEGAWFMIHDAWGSSSGSADDLENWAGVLRGASANIAKAYAARTGRPAAEIADMMAAETWMTAAEAKAKGFVDAIIPMNAKASASATDRSHTQASLRSVAFAVASGDYTNLPAALREKAALMLAERPPAPKDAPQEEPEITMDMKQITSALNLIEGADERSILGAIAALKGTAAFANAVHGVLGKSGDEGIAALGTLKASASLAKSVETETGKAGEEALGTIQAWKKSAARVPALETEVETGKASAEVTELSALLKKGADEKKLTKAESDKLKARVEGAFKARAEKRDRTDDEWTLAQAKAFVDALSPQPGFQAPSVPADGGTALAVKHADKSYEDMTVSERATLRASEGGEAIYKDLRADWERRGKPRKAPKAA